MQPIIRQKFFIGVGQPQEPDNCASIRVKLALSLMITMVHGQGQIRHLSVAVKS